ncbi:hypothetical protein HD597_002739 [Nonomuraea thailandensis]|uniref:Uncharacterized protein n=1 Tax=Nonomuraea thailandensis TaxID=1188745 RepID=A0A9X2K0V7_9ACTN|nr:hypothetical protein [Nonomuraea thailandensis]MCP2355719.1 hypothetical protein [Nonomuraea thailandensis]
MIPALYGLLALIQAALAVRLARSGQWIPFAVAVGVAYDSAVIGAGALTGEGPALDVLSTGRFAAHAVLTPLLIVHAAALTRRGLLAAAWALAGALIVWDVVALAELRLEPRWWAGTLRLVSADPPGPPVAALATTVVLLAAGIVLWVRRRTPWLAAGAAALLASAGAAVAVPILGNAGEAVLIAALVVTSPAQEPAGHGPRS